MDTANYLQKWLPIKRVNGFVVGPKKAWTVVKQNVKHICIFDSKASTHIPIEKRSKSDIQKMWNRIFIGYTNTIQ